MFEVVNYNTIYNFAVSSLQKGKKLKDNILESSFFRSESPFLPGTGSEKIVQPIEGEPKQLASITTSKGIDSTPNTVADKESAIFPANNPSLEYLNDVEEDTSAVEYLGGVEEDTSAMVPPALQHNVIVRNLTASWKDEKVDKEDTEKEKKMVEKKDKEAEAGEEAEEEAEEEGEKEVLKNVSFEVSRVWKYSIMCNMDK